MCETWHGPSAEQVRDPARRVPENPGRYSADAINALCGDCHRMPAGATETTGLRDPWNARHQPLTLAASVCYRASEGKLSCLTYHSPHEVVDRNLAHYGQRCLGCHAQVRHVGKIAGRACAECHMPPVRPQANLEFANLEFANHRIAIYGERDPLTPVVRKR